LYNGNPENVYFNKDIVKASSNAVSKTSSLYLFILIKDLRIIFFYYFFHTFWRFV
ncbi:hypothetical protein BgiMline_031613, partial [Biomphalaria glabrata]